MNSRTPFALLLPEPDVVARREQVSNMDANVCREEVLKVFPTAGIHGDYPGLTNLLVREPHRNWRGQFPLGSAVSADDCWRHAYADHVLGRKK